MTNVILKFDEASEIKEFINNNESGIYGGKNVDGKEIIVLIQKGEGMVVKTKQSNGWYRVTEYDGEGIYLGETYEKAGRQDDSTSSKY